LILLLTSSKSLAGFVMLSIAPHVRFRRVRRGVTDKPTQWCTDQKHVRWFPPFLGFSLFRPSRLCATYIWGQSRISSGLSGHFKN